jgi:hypothetical protein
MRNAGWKTGISFFIPHSAFCIELDPLRRTLNNPLTSRRKLFSGLDPEELFSC